MREILLSKWTSREAWLKALSSGGDYDPHGLPLRVVKETEMVEGVEVVSYAIEFIMKDRWDGKDDSILYRFDLASDSVREVGRGNRSDLWEECR